MQTALSVLHPPCSRLSATQSNGVSHVSRHGHVLAKLPASMMSATQSSGVSHVSGQRQTVI